eukprot:4911183-Pyramimonas_sp.AAC.1
MAAAISKAAKTGASTPAVSDASISGRCVKLKNIVDKIAARHKSVLSCARGRGLNLGVSD